MISVTEIKNVWLKGWEEFIRNTEGYGLRPWVAPAYEVSDYISEELARQ